MTRFKPLFLLLALLTLTGAGCLSDNSQGSGTDGGVFRSANRGELWTQMTALPTAQGVASIAATSVVSLEMDPQDVNVLYAATKDDGLVFTLDGGRSWQRPLQTSLRSGRIHAVAVNPKDTCTLYVAKGRRLYKSTNCLRTFNDEMYVETRSGVNIFRVAVDWFNPQVVWLGLSNGDVLKSVDAGMTWKNVISAGQDISAILINKLDSRMVLVATSNVGLYKTTDSGKTWTHIQKSLSDFVGAKNVYLLTQDVRSRVVLASTRYGLMRSLDFGETWRPVEVLTAPGQVLISAIAMDPHDPQKIYYGTGSTFYSTQDGGTTWKTMKIQSTRSQSALLVDPSDTNVLYVGLYLTE